MTTQYPAGFDSFSVPGSPSTTPLSSAGDSTRNHTTSHQDLGDAVMAIQNNVTQLTHTHDGTGLNGSPIDQVNSHNNPDTDSQSNALHHTLGLGQFQAAAGNHQHSNYVDLASNQNISGQKTFPNNSSGIVIPTFINSQHSHNSAAEGGAVCVGIASSHNHENLHPTTFGSNVTTLFYLTSTFTMPANMFLVGTVLINLIWNNGSASDVVGDTSMYVGYNVGPTGAVYSDTFNITTNGVSDHSRIRASVGAHDTVYAQMTAPFLLNPTTTDRVMRLSAKMVNAGAATIPSVSMICNGYLSGALSY